eukprot:2754523-Pyramimonas_sp.AAC.1
MVRTASPRHVGTPLTSWPSTKLQLGSKCHGPRCVADSCRHTPCTFRCPRGVAATPLARLVAP